MAVSIFSRTYFCHGLLVSTLLSSENSIVVPSPISLARKVLG